MLAAMLAGSPAASGTSALLNTAVLLDLGAVFFAIFLAMYENNDLFNWARDIFIWGMLAATALSGLQYLWKAFALLNKTD